MKRTCLSLCLLALVAPACLPAQTAAQPDAQTAAQTPVQSQAPAIALAQLKAKKHKKELVEMKPFSRVALSGGISLMGINMQLATNVNRYLNLRGVGNVLQYSVNNIKTGGSDGADGVNVTANLNFATAGLALDYYPFPKHSLRISPGVMLYNQNEITANGVAAAGSSISLDGTKYYSESGDPMGVNASLGLNNYKQAFMLSAGWGNMIPRNGGHWSFPFELGAVFTGAPRVSFVPYGSACLSQSDAQSGSGSTCLSLNDYTSTLGQQFKTNLDAQVAKYQNDVNVIKVYPILSFGVAYNFKIR